MLIDTHCHLDARKFAESPAELVEKAAKVGVRQIIVPSVARQNFSAVQKICAENKACFPALGIHPLFTATAEQADLMVLREQITTQRPLALGEIGLDFFVENFDAARQEYYFFEQLKLAREFDLPLLLHSRRALDNCLKYLRRYPVRGGIAHAFNGSRQQADELIKLGFKLGFGGAMTYPRANHLRELASALPLSSLVLETDAPDMPPNFVLKGEPNKPEYLPKIAQVLAELRGLTLAEIASVTSQNAREVLPSLNGADCVNAAI
jgi:TatD DNase family protein